MTIGSARKAYLDDPDCGDACASWQAGPKTVICIVDGLGHSRPAAEAAEAALAYTAAHLEEPLPALFAGCDAALRQTRGVAMGVAVIEGDTLTYAAVGNIRALIAGPSLRRLPHHFGVVGGGYHNLVQTAYPFDTTRDRLILYTDGIPELFDLKAYPYRQGDVQQLAHSILQDHARQTDDAAVLVYQPA